MGGKGEMGLRLFPINDNTITSRSTTNMLKEFAFFLHFMCENSSNLSSSDDIQGGKSLLGSADLKSRPVYKKIWTPSISCTDRNWCRFRQRVLGLRSLHMEMRTSSRGASSYGHCAAKSFGR